MFKSVLPHLTTTEFNLEDRTRNRNTQCECWLLNFISHNNHWFDPRGPVPQDPNSFNFVESFIFLTKILGSHPTRIPLSATDITAAPSTPVIDVPKCSRSSSSVVIVLSPPENESDVIDGYYVYYCSNEQRQAGDQVSVLPFVFTPLKAVRWFVYDPLHSQ